MVVYLYRWKLKAEKVEQFKSAWSVVTAGLREHCGSLGSRLHRGNDEIYYGYAQWPSVEVRNNAKLETDQIRDAHLLMRDAIDETLPEIMLDPVSDYLILKK